MKNNASFAYALLLIAGDFLALILAFSVAYILRVKVDTRPLVEQIPAITYFYTVVTVLPLWIMANALIGLYSPSVYEKRFSELGRLFVGSVLGILFVIGFDFVAESELFPARLVPVYGLLLGFSFLVLFRSAAHVARRLMFKYGVGISNVLIVGKSEVTAKIAQNISDTKNTGLKVVGVVGHKVDGFRHFADFKQAVEQLKAPLHAIIQTEISTDQNNNDVLEYAQEHHISYRSVPGSSDLFVGKITVELFAGGVPMIAVHPTALIGWGRITKRLFDFVISLVTLIVLSPVILLIAICLFLFDPGPVFFRQKRVTRHNKIFKIYKFRTTKKKYNGLSPEEAFESMGKPELAQAYRKGGDKLPNDPRFGVIGRFLRRTSLDELPQLFNVLSGDISLVGPRALVPEEINAAAFKHHIVSVKSGMTGLAQVAGRRDISFEERRRLDVYYVQNWSFWLDITILLKTVKAVFNREPS